MLIVGGDCLAQRSFARIFVQIKKGYFVTRDDPEPLFLHPSSINHRRFVGAAGSGRQVGFLERLANPWVQTVAVLIVEGLLLGCFAASGSGQSRVVNLG